jgi:predicted nucleic acid-binding protein
VRSALRSSNRTLQFGYLCPQTARDLVDRVSFVVMRDLGVNVALAFDAHFQRAGFQLYGNAS